MDINPLVESSWDPTNQLSLNLERARGLTLLGRTVEGQIGKFPNKDAPCSLGLVL